MQCFRIPFILLFSAIVGWPLTDCCADNISNDNINNDRFVTRKTTQLRLEGKPYRFAGANVYWLGLDDNLRDPDGSPSYPTDFRVKNALDAAVKMGVTVIRSHTLGISVGNPKSFQPTLDHFNDSALERIDYAIYQAKKRNLRLIIPLTDQWRYYHGGKWVFVHWAAQAAVPAVMDVKPDLAKTVASDYIGDDSEKFIEQQFYNNPVIVGYFKSYITRLLNHVNRYTKVALKDEPAILAWETGNELFDAPTDWTQEIAHHIRHNIGAKQLIADGSAASGNRVSKAALTAEDVDIVGGHFYQWPSGLDTDWLIEDVEIAKRAGKVYIVGEWGWSQSNRAAFLTAIEDTPAAAGDLFWSLLPYQEDGTPEPHARLEYGTDDVPLYLPAIDLTMEVGVADLIRHAKRMKSLPIKGRFGPQ